MKYLVSAGHRFLPFVSKTAVGALSLSLAVLVVCLPAFSQGNAGRILGAVTDQTGGAVVGVTVTILDTQRNLTRTVTTDNAGEYNAPNLLPGTYTVSAAFQGFKTAVRSGVTLELNQDLRVDLTLQPGEQTEKVTVTEAIPLVETTNAELGGTLQAQIIDTLPLNGRNFENLLQLRPGVTIYPGGSGWTQSTNGQRAHDNVYMVNGIMASDPWMGQSVFNAVMAAGDAGTILPVDAIDEFKTEENPRAEYGWKPGAIVNVGIKSGTNNIHGSGYAYGRDTALDARNYFNPPYAANPTQQPVALEQFGGTLGGPIKKDKLFYFVNYEGQRYSIGNPARLSVPATVSTGDPKHSLIDACLAAGTKVTLLSASLAGLNPSTCTPAPNQPSGGFLGLFPVSPTGILNTDLSSVNGINGGLVKVNYHLSDKNNLEGMYFISQGDNVAVDAPLAQVAVPWLSAQHARSQAGSGDWTWTPSSAWVNEVRFGYAHYYQTFFGNDISQNPANYSFNGNTYEVPTGITNPLYFGMPGMTFQGGFQNQIGVGWPKIVGPDGVINIVDHISYLRGKHAFKFGGEVVANLSSEDETSNAKGPLRFHTLVGFFEGNPNRARLFVGDPVRHLNSKGYAGFFQDDWRVKPTLTVNLGLRYEINTVVHDKNGELANFDPVNGIVQSNNPYHGDHKDFAPRLGLVWDIGGKGKTVLRAAAGIVYEQMSFDVLNGEGNLLGLRTMPTGIPRFNAGTTTSLPTSGNIDLQSLTMTGPALAPIQAAWQAFNPALPVSGQQTLYAAVATPACGDNFTNPSGYLVAPTACEIYGVDPNLRTPYVTNWNLDIQRAITSNLSIDVGYVGNHSSNLLGKININQPPPGAGWTPAAIANCLGSAGDGLTGGAPYDACAPDPNAEQAAQPFTAPCAASINTNWTSPGVPGPAVPLGANSSGGPFNPNNSCFSYLSYITIVKNLYHANYNGLQATLTARNWHGLSVTSGYTVSHALGMASDQGTGANFPTAPNSYGNLRNELYASTDFDVRHRFTFTVNYAIPGRKGFGQLLEGWSVNSIVLIQSGLPWGLSDQTTDFSGTNNIGSNAGPFGEMWNFYGNPKDFTPVHGFTDTNGGTGGLPFFPGTATDPVTGNTIINPALPAACTSHAAALGPLGTASLVDLGCYSVGNSVLIPAAYGSYGSTTQNLWRDHGFRNWDFSIAKAFTLKERFKAEFRAEFFNILNTPDFSNPSGGPGGGIGDPSGGPPFGFSGLTPDTYSSNPQLGSGGARAIQLGLRLSF